MKLLCKNLNNKKNNSNITEKFLIHSEELKRKTKIGPRINWMLSLKDPFMA